MNALELTGRAVTHVVLHPTLKRVLQPEVAEAWLSMSEAAAKSGHTLSLISAFRSFDRQLLIWNEKWNGVRPLLDAQEKPLNAAALSPQEKLQAILLWSALPGTSRHHWGTDLDVIDLAAWPTQRPVDLLQNDFAVEGCQHPLHLWLETHASKFGFIRPYSGQGSVQAEPWHLSYAAIATPAHDQVNSDLVAQALSSSPIEGKDLILSQLETLLPTKTK